MSAVHTLSFSLHADMGVLVRLFKADITFPVIFSALAQSLYSEKLNMVWVDASSFGFFPDVVTILSQQAWKVNKLH